MQGIVPTGVNHLKVVAGEATELIITTNKNITPTITAIIKFINTVNITTKTFVIILLSEWLL